MLLEQGLGGPPSAGPSSPPVAWAGREGGAPFPETPVAELSPSRREERAGGPAALIGRAPKGGLD